MPSKSIEPVYGMSGPNTQVGDDDSRRARTYRATYELHDRAGEFTSVLFAAAALPDGVRTAARGIGLSRDAEFSAGRARPGLGACLTSWASYGGEQLLREAIGVPDGWLVAGHIVVRVA